MTPQEAAETHLRDGKQTYPAGSTLLFWSAVVLTMLVGLVPFFIQPNDNSPLWWLVLVFFPGTPLMARWVGQWTEDK